MSQIYSGKTRIVPIAISTSGDNELIAAPTDGYIAIDHINLMPTTAVGVKFKSGSTDLSGVYPLDTKQPITLEDTKNKEVGILFCGHNEAFKINLDAGVACNGFLTYRVIGDK